MGAQQSDNGPLSQFCCNNNLCQNDNNIDNINGMQDNHIMGGRKNQYRKSGHGSNQSISSNKQFQPQSVDQFGNRIQSQTQLQPQQNNFNNQMVNNTSNMGNYSAMDNSQNMMNMNNPGMNQNMNNQGLTQNQGNGFDNNMGGSIPNPNFQGNAPANPQQQPQMSGFGNLGAPMNVNMNNAIPDQQQQSQQQAQMMLNYKKQCQDVVNTSPILQLEVVSSASLPKGQTITINSCGLFGNFTSERERSQPNSGNDGFTYFGAMAEMYDQDGQPQHDIHNPVGQTIIANDFVIPYRNSEQADAHRGRHFQIWFDVYSKQYFIKDLGIGFGVFKKMQNGSAILKDNHLINVGEAYIVVNLLPEGAEEKGLAYDTLKLKMFGGPGSGEVYEYNFNDMRGGDRDILIGRTPDCDVSINDKLLSKVQSHIKLQQVQADQSNSKGMYQWTLFDGYKGKNSTNGTWLYINEDTPLYDGVIFKANQTIFNCRILQPQGA